MRRFGIVFAPWMGLIVGLSGCQHPSVTAVSLDHYCDHKFAFLYDPCKDHEGIPFYLPKPLLIVAKNFRNIEDAKTGLTDPVPIPGNFDDQSKYADLNSRSAFSGGSDAAPGPTTAASPDVASVFPGQNIAPGLQTYTYSSQAPQVSPRDLVNDNLTPETFYTYQIIFVPDMTQKYGLKVKGGAGELRAAMNLVNGWQFTGIGPFYMKDSSTSQNTLSAGIAANLAARGVGDLIKDIASLNPGSTSSTTTPGTPKGQGKLLGGDGATAIIQSLQDLNLKPMRLSKFAEIAVYEAYITPEGTMEWKPIHKQEYDRDVLGAIANPTPPVVNPPATKAPVVNPPATKAPVVNPPAANPPAANPPAANPPAANPPAANPPAGNPPAGNPPAGNPPAGNPPAGNPPAGNPPASGGGTPKKKTSWSGPAGSGAGDEIPTLMSPTPPPANPEAFPALIPLSEMSGRGALNDPALVRTQAPGAGDSQSSLFAGAAQPVAQKPTGQGGNQDGNKAADSSSQGTEAVLGSRKTTRTIPSISTDPVSTALIAKRLGLSIPTAPATAPNAATPAAPTAAPITINQYAAPASKSDTAPAPARHRWFHRQKPRSKVQVKSTNATGVGVAAPTP